MIKKETRILTNNTQTCIVFEEREKTFSEIELSAEKYFSDSTPPAMAEGFMGIIILSVIYVVSLGEPIYRDSLLFYAFFLLFVAVMVTIGLRLLASMVARFKTGKTSWRMVLLNAISEYQPQDAQSYRYFVARILENGLQKESVSQWLVSERNALNAREQEMMKGKQEMMKGKHFSEKEEKIVKELKRRLEEG